MDCTLQPQKIPEMKAASLLVNRSGGRADFGVPLISLLDIDTVTYVPKDCPLCAAGVELTHPGSR